MKQIDKTIKTLEFDKIRELLAGCALTAGAKELARTLEPSSSEHRVRETQNRTADAKYLIGIKGHPSFGLVKDPEECCDRADKGAVLSPGELLDIANLLRTTRGLIDYIKTDKRKDTVLDEIFMRLIANKFLEDKITRSIIAEDMIADEASPELSDIRRKIKQTNSKIRESLQSYISGPKYSKFLRENIVTMRDGRYVIPVKSEYRNEIKGLIHDTSTTGATVFVEPMTVVEANNELRVLASKEQHEIDRILSDLSAGCASFGRDIVLNYKNITELAFIFACGELSFKMDASEPTVRSGGYLRLRRARHPLLDKKTVVPIDVSLGLDYKTLVITGPNTGGKTVTLKTIGLLSLMVQAGLQVPVESGSEFTVFDDIFVDIGDEQSIEQSLSTFSSHMTNIVSILDGVSDNCLVLADELGSGTDPVEGAALAVSILDEIRARGAFCAATTHYSELKTYALDTEGVCNASCEFDVNTLRPTYRLIIGTPGKSNAFEISEKLGMPDKIISRARDLISKENRQFESVISNLESSRIEMEKETTAAKEEREAFEKYKRETEREIKRLLAEAKVEKQKASEKAASMVEAARASSEFVFAELDRVRKKKESENLAKELEDARRSVKTHLKTSSVKFDPVETIKNDKYVLPRALKVGDEVLLVSIGAHGTVLALPDKDGNVEVKAGLIKTRVKLKDLQLVNEEATVVSADKKKMPVSGYRAVVNRDFKSEIDVRGENGEDAWILVDKYIDEAKLAGFENIRVIHGKGTGALRSALWKFFKADKRVISFRAGEYGEGDTGVTVVQIK